MPMDIPLNGAIRYENVGVWAEDQERWMLRDINLEIEPAQPWASSGRPAPARACSSACWAASMIRMKARC